MKGALLVLYESILFVVFQRSPQIEFYLDSSHLYLSILIYLRFFENDYLI